jgi:hypothetical protein
LVVLFQQPRNVNGSFHWWFLEVQALAAAFEVDKHNIGH